VALSGFVRRLSNLVRPKVDAAGYARLRAGVLVLGILVIMGFAASTGYDAWRSYGRTVESTDHELENLSSALAEQTSWSLRGPVLLLGRIARRYPAYSRLPPGRIGSFLVGSASRAPQVVSVQIVDARGFVRDSSFGIAATGANVSDRSYFRAQEGATDQGLYVSAPHITSADAVGTVILSRRLVDRRGRFAGIVTARVALRDLSGLYAAMHLKGQIAVALMRDDGILLVHSPALPDLVGHRYLGLRTLKPGEAARIRNPIDGRREFIAARPVGSTPLFLAVTRSEAAALNPVYQEAFISSVRTLVLVLFGVLAIIALLRQLRRIEQVSAALRQSLKMEALGTLAGGIAHDFNNILGAIIGYGELAQQQAQEGTSLRRHLDQIMHATARARSLVDRILGFSRSGIAERVPIDIQAVVAETLRLLEASLPPNVRIEKALHADGAAVIGDDTRLHQVTMNLCTNAVQAMPDGGILRVELGQLRLAASRTFSREQLAAGRYVILTVKDSGVGIPPDVMERIFDPFFTTKPLGVGTGLGLSLVHGIVADLDGAIEVSSEPARGTTFRIWLPVTSEHATRAAAMARDLPRGKGEAVMVVDDEPALVALAEELLANLGYEPVGFRSGRSALEAFLGDPRRFDAVLTDELMPDLHGTELAREVRSLSAEVPILLVTGHGGDALAERARAAGVTEVLRKPLRTREMAEALAKHLAAVAVDAAVDGGSRFSPSRCCAHE
jgi:signal transduction histidine kinase/CheY-like chemotaxis protein